MKHEEIFGVVTRAIGEHKGISIVYQNDRAMESTLRDVLPFWLTHSKRSAHTYVQCYCRLRRTKRSFRFDRIITAELRDIEVPIEGYRFIGGRNRLLQAPIGVVAGVFTNE